MNIGIIGAGRISFSMANTLKGMQEKGHNVKRYAVAARDLNRAQEFAREHGFEKAYGSYLELVQDPAVDLVYIATPHSHHAEHMELCINHGKPVLCEKSFTRNKKEAEKVLKLAKEKNVMVTEAIWTRYMPSRKMIDDLLSSQIIGKPLSLSANLHYPITHKERIMEPELAGGALLDVGVYPLNFALMHFGTEIERIESSASLTEKGVDGTNSFTLYYKDGRTAYLNSGIYARSDRKGIIYGEKGYIIVDNINNPQTIQAFGMDDELLQSLTVPEQINGYEYEVMESCSTIAAGNLECQSIPHAETLRVMEIMDSLRQKWGVKYPGE